MKSIISVRSYGSVGSVDLSSNIVSRLSFGEKVILDFKGIVEIDPAVLEGFIIRIFNSFSYNEIKTKFGYKNLQPKIRRSIQLIIERLVNKNR